MGEVGTFALLGHLPIEGVAEVAQALGVVGEVGSDDHDRLQTLAFELVEHVFLEVFVPYFLQRTNELIKIN